MLALIHAEGGPFDPCDKLIHPSICVNFHPMVDIGSFCVSLHVGSDPILGRLGEHRVAISGAHWRGI